MVDDFCCLLNRTDFDLHSRDFYLFFCVNMLKIQLMEMVGRLLREVQPELMDGLIQATKDGDQSKFQELSGTKLAIDDEEESEEEIAEEEEEEVRIDVTLILLAF